MPSNERPTARYLGAILAGWLLVVAAGLVLFQRFAPVVAPKLSPSLAFNQKAQWLRGHRECDVLVLGSSIALNNVDGPALEHSLPGSAVVNTGSWGMTLSDSGRMYQSMLKRCQPRLLLVPVYYGDFSVAGQGAHRSSEIDWKRFDRYLDDRVSVFDKLRSMDLDYLYTSYSHLRSPKYSNNRYFTSLAFDETGGVVLQSAGFERDQRRWNGYLVKSREVLDQNQVDALGELLASAKARGTPVVVVRTPMTREANRSFESARTRGLWMAVASVVEEHGGEFVDLGGLYLPDDDFADFCHLNDRGTKLVTGFMQRADAFRSVAGPVDRFGGSGNVAASAQ